MSLMRAPVVNDRASRDHKLLAWVPGRAGLVARAVHSLVVCYRHGLGWTVLGLGAGGRRAADPGHHRAGVG